MTCYCLTCNKLVQVCECAPLAELADAADLKFAALERAGSIPAGGTIKKERKQNEAK